MVAAHPLPFQRCSMRWQACEGRACMRHGMQGVTMHSVRTRAHVALEP